LKKFWIQVKTELKLHLREPEAIFWGFVFPVIMIVVLGFLFSKKDELTNELPVGATQSFIDSPISSRFIESFNYKLHPVEDSDIERLLITEKHPFVFSMERHGVITLHFATFSTILKDEERTKLLDFIHQENVRLLQDSIPYALKTKEVIVKSDRGQDVNYVSWLIPGVIALNLFLSCIFGIGISIVQDKRKGKLKKIATTPLPKINFIMAISIQRMFVLLLQIVVICIAGYLIFNVFITGSIFELLITYILSMLSFMVFGFAIAAVSNTIEKAIALSNLFFILAIVISGAYFPNTGLPNFMKFFADLLPVTMSVDLSRAVFAYGDSIWNHWTEIFGLIAWIVVSLLISIKLFKWHSD
jgi:ABC-2 type transport system permease protein